MSLDNTQPHCLSHLVKQQNALHQSMSPEHVGPHVFIGARCATSGKKANSSNQQLASGSISVKLIQQQETALHHLVMTIFLNVEFTGLTMSSLHWNLDWHQIRLATQFFTQSVMMLSLLMKANCSSVFIIVALVSGKTMPTLPCLL